MGRKKIEIRPLIDERNRNVTFLKRKAGLMKKAWELSVLCAADVSILIFSNSGKPYEFSSKDLDGEFDRYLDYEGMIERRRAPEFAAAAAAGEDDDDEDDEETGRRSSTKPGKQGGPPGPGKSLKGKESFKSRQPTRNDYERSKRKRRRDTNDRRGFIEGLVSQGSSDEDEDKPDLSRIRHTSDMSSMQYAMNMHQTPNYPPQSAARLSYPSQNYRDQPLQASYANYSSTPFTSQSQMQTPYQSYPPATSQPPSNNFMPNNMQWDPEMLSRYAEYQLQQNHQRQQRILLERQRHQLAELGIPVDDSGLLDQLFAGGSAPAPQASSSSHSHQQSQGTPQGEDMDQAGFIWPTATARSATAANQHGSRPTVPGISPAPGMLDHLYNMGRDGAVKEGDDTGFAWPTGGTVPGAEGFLPSPDSAEAMGKKRGGSPFYGGSDDKRSRVY